MGEGLDYLKIRGARQHNLKGIDLDLPKNKLIVFTGVSGSGKSSLAFDTIYAEGQRRYVESLSSYARQFLGIMDKPEVEMIEGLSPAIAINQKQPSRNPRSTVGTLTEIYDYLRLLFARVGHPHCPECGREIKNMSPQEIVTAIRESLPGRQSGPGRRLLILAPLVKDRKGEYGQLFAHLKRDGFSQARVDGQIINLASPPVLLKTNRHSVELVIERLVLRRETPDQAARLNEAVERALRLAQGELIVAEVTDPSYEFPKEPKKMRDTLFSERFACPDCNLALPEIEPRSFSFNSPHGACPACDGLGTQMKIDPELILAPQLTLSEGGIIPLASTFSRDTWFARLVAQVAAEHGFSSRQPLESLKPSQLRLLLYGSGKRLYRVRGTNRFGRTTEIVESFSGVIPLLQRRYRELKSSYARAEIERFMRIDPCPTCQGKRLKKESLSVTINEKNISQITSLAAAEALNWVGKLDQQLSGREKEIAAPIAKELAARLNFLSAVGLDYLSLDRTASTLAGGEIQRIRLASQIGSGLCGVLYVLDEPSVGLHPRDQGRLLKTLQGLRDLGNTVIVVEHDRDTIMAADLIIDFGPGAGSAGGEVVAVGTPGEITRSPVSLTGKYLSGRRTIAFKKGSPAPKLGPKLTLTGVRHHNLKDITVSFPLGKLICVTGVSGSGKSSLVEEVLYRAVAARYRGSRERPGEYGELIGAEALENVVMVDQSPIGRTPRSNPATYTGAFTPIRELFSQTKEAKIRGYKPGRFSFNVKGGRCEACRGEGQLKIEMQFLSDIYVACEVCEGRRYQRQTLEIEYRGKNIADVLKMSVKEALAFFKAIPPIKNKLSTLSEVGLSYVELGQPAPTLSGGEAQRVKLANELCKRQSGKTLYLLDEPTTGLHFVDLERLLGVLFKLVSFGNTVVVIEHNLDVIKNADWIIDLGPEGGEKGGEVVVAGPPDKVALSQESHTGRALKNVLEI